MSQSYVYERPIDGGVFENKNILDWLPQVYSAKSKKTLKARMKTFLKGNLTNKSVLKLKRVISLIK